MSLMRLIMTVLSTAAVHLPLYRLEIYLTCLERGGVAAAGQISSRHSLAILG